MRGLLEDGKSDASDPDLALQTIAFIAKLKQQQAEA